jgi:hypothetical protein
VITDRLGLNTNRILTNKHGLDLNGVPYVLDDVDAIATGAWCRREAGVVAVSTVVGISVTESTMGIRPA